MKKKLISTLFLFIFTLTVSSQNKRNDFVSENISFASQQVWKEVQKNAISKTILLPRTINDSKQTTYISISDWTSGFFPGSLWYLYDLTKHEKWKQAAIRYTLSLDSVKYLKIHHDVGFMIECSYGNGLRLTNNQAYKDVIVEAANSLMTRFKPAVGLIQSWDSRTNIKNNQNWGCPVIIDNMMNLQLLFDATRFTGDSVYWKAAISHADKTLTNHFRKDNSCYHLVDYNLIDGSVIGKHTVQGYADESAWARGQAWAIYGYTVCYRYTKDKKYLLQAEKTMDFVLKNKNLPNDFIPYWDFDAPKIPNEPRDASSAAIIASALYELCKYSKPDYYKKIADRMMISLAGNSYRAKLNENNNFILMHSVGNIPFRAEIDVPLNYADYYFLEALSRKRNLEKI
ncbi:MAG: glycoside hydrolase family 88 protein [Paludibacter sp.]